MSEDNNNEIFEDAPKKITERTKKIIFFVLAGIIVVFTLFMNLFNGASETKKSKDNTVMGIPKAHVPVNTIQDDNQTQNALLNQEQRISELENRIEQLPNLITSEFKEEIQTIKQRQNRQRVSGVSTEYKLSYRMRKRMSSAYQSMVNHFSRHNQWQIDESEYSSLRKRNVLANVEPQNRELYTGAFNTSSGMDYRLPSGTRVIVVTESEVNSDHPGYFISRVVRPHILRNFKLICQSGFQTNNRIQIQITKLVSPTGKDLELSGQVQMKYPGLEGEVSRHILKRLGPNIANAAIGGGFIAWTMQGQGDRISTRDAMVAPIVESSVSGLQNEVSKLGGDVPNTITVPSGTQFEVLLTSPLKVTL